MLLLLPCPDTGAVDLHQQFHADQHILQIPLGRRNNAVPQCLIDVSQKLSPLLVHLCRSIGRVAPALTVMLRQNILIQIMIPRLQLLQLRIPHMPLIHEGIIITQFL